jgi:ribulose-5-phosphate 4-epimerase/fuculose-1-phosphate aldolase
LDVPVYDIGPLYEAGERQDMLVKDQRFGTALASHFSKDPEFDKPALDYNVVLMRRHGYTTHGADMETAVYRAIYTKINAGVQTNSMMLRQAFNQTSKLKEKFDFDPLTPEQCEGCTIMNEGTQDKPWKLWVQEVEESKLYVNRG